MWWKIMMKTSQTTDNENTENYMRAYNIAGNEVLHVCHYNNDDIRNFRL